MSLLEVRGLRAGYEGIPVVFGVDLDVDEGEIVALLGANGAGKTTTLRAVSGMVPLMAGTVRFGGEDVSRRPAERITRGGLLHVPAGRGIFPSLTVGDTLRLAAALAGLSAADAQRRIAEAEATFPRLAERTGQTAGTLSGGEQQMLAMARGLIAQPRLLMVDEMSQGLAPTIVAELFAVLHRFTEQGIAVLLVEQFVGQALELASRAYVLEKGEVTFSGTAAQLAADEEFVRGSYLGDVDATPAASADSPAGLAEQLTVSLPPVLIRSLQERAEREGVPVADLVRDAVEGSVSRRRKTGTTGGRRGR
jgi:branched-chain amino acid transport system ATP-binding protein